MTWLLFAQLPSIDPISGGAGWLGAGLLGLLLWWLLLKHLPEKDKQAAIKDAQIKQLIDEHVAAMERLHDDCAEERKEQFNYFNDALNRIIERHSKDHELTAKTLRDELESLRTAIVTLGQAVDALRHSGRSNADQSTRSKQTT